jgi:hypothetical protein
MKIKVPVTAIEANLTDREMVLVNLILQFLLDGDIGASDVVVDTEFYFHENDIKQITRHQHGGLDGPAFTRLREVLVFKKTIRDKVAVTLKSPKMNRIGKHKGSIKMGDHILTDQRAINLYFYLIGITSVKGVVQEFKNLRDMPRSKSIEWSRLVKVAVY